MKFPKIYRHQKVKSYFSTKGRLEYNFCFSFSKSIHAHLSYKDWYAGGRMLLISHNLYKKSMAGVKHEIEMKNLQSNNRHMKQIPKGNRRATGKK